MANLTPADNGLYHTTGADGSDVYLPEDVARSIPDFAGYFQPQPVEPAMDQPSLTPDPSQAAPEVAEVAPAPAPVAPAPAAAPRPPVSTSHSYSYSGTLPHTTRAGLIDVHSAVEPYDRAAREQYALGEEAVAARAQHDAVQLQKDEALVPLRQQEADLAASVAPAYNEIDQRVEAELAQHERQIQAQIAAIPQMRPNRFWQDQSKFEQGVSTIAMIVGALDGLNNGGGNKVAETAHQMIQNDLRAQEQDIATAKSRVQFANDAYDRASRQGYYDKVDLKESYAMKAAALAAAIEAEGQKYQSKFTRAKFGIAAVELRQMAAKGANEYMHLRQQTAVSVQKSNQDTLDAAAARADANARFRISEANTDRRRAEDRAAKGAEGDTRLRIIKDSGFSRPVIGPDGKPTGEDDHVYINIADETLARSNWEKIQTQASGAREFFDAIDELTHIDFKRLNGPDKGAYLSHLRDRLVLAKSKATGTNATRGTDKDIGLLSSAVIAAADLGMLNKTSAEMVQRVAKRVADQTERNLESDVRELANDPTVRFRRPPSQSAPQQESTDFIQAEQRMRDTKVGKVTKGEYVPKRPAPGESYTPREAPLGQPLAADPGAYEFRPGATSDVNPDMDNVAAIMSDADVILRDLAAGEMAPGQQGSAALTLIEHSQQLHKRGYHQQAKELETAAWAIHQRLADDAGRKASESVDREDARLRPIRGLR